MIDFSSQLLFTLKQDALYNSCTTCPMLVFEACGKVGSSFCTTNITNTFLDSADPSSNANKTSLSTSSCIAGPRNWHPLVLTAAHKLADSCWGFWCWSISSVTDRSPRDLAALIRYENLLNALKDRLFHVVFRHSSIIV